MLIDMMSAVHNLYKWVLKHHNTYISVRFRKLVHIKWDLRPINLSKRIALTTGVVKPYLVILSSYRFWKLTTGLTVWTSYHDLRLEALLLWN